MRWFYVGIRACGAADALYVWPDQIGCPGSAVRGAIYEVFATVPNVGLMMELAASLNIIDCQSPNDVGRSVGLPSPRIVSSKIERATVGSIRPWDSTFIGILEKPSPSEIRRYDDRHGKCSGKNHQAAIQTLNITAIVANYHDCDANQYEAATYKNCPYNKRRNKRQIGSPCVCLNTTLVDEGNKRIKGPP